MSSRSTSAQDRPSPRRASSFPALLALALATLLGAAAASGCGQGGRARDLSTGGDDGGWGGAGGTGGSGTGGDKPAVDPLPLRVLNWNVKNFLNNKDDSPEAGEVVVSTADYLAHRKGIGGIIKSLDPDIAFLQEVENLATLEDLVKSELDGAYTSVALIDGNDGRGIDIGVIARVPFASVVSHKDDQFPLNGTQGPLYRYARDCLEVHVKYNGRNVTFLGVHFKAKDNDAQSGLKRLAEAQHTRALADTLASQDPSQAILVLGDYNDTPSSKPYLAVIGEGTTQYKNALDNIPQADRWSYNYQGKLELIDHQMSNPSLAAMLDPASVLALHNNAAKDVSDHAPVIATYLVK